MAIDGYFYYGCFNRNGKGHHWYDTDGNVVNTSLPSDFPEDVLKNPTQYCHHYGESLDPANPQPPLVKQIQGETCVTPIDGWTITATWDRTSDTRDDSVTVMAVRGTFDFDTSISQFQNEFSSIYNRMNLAGITFFECGTISPACIVSLSEGVSSNTTFDNACYSTNHSGDDAKYFTFTLSRTGDISFSILCDNTFTIDLIDGVPGSTNIIQTDSGLAATPNFYTYTLGAGTYCVEISASGFVSGNSITVKYDYCNYPITINSSVSGTLAGGCSDNTGTTFAKYYQFTLSSLTTVDATLTSSDFDGYLYLHTGTINATTATGATVIAGDDNSGGLSQDPQIVTTLPAGSYTWEVAIIPSGTPIGAGTFDFYFYEDLAACDDNIVLDGGSVPASVTNTCPSFHGGTGFYAHYFKFSLASPTTVDVTVAPTTFTPQIFILAGTGHTGDVLYSGVGNTLSSAGLSPGNYVIEVTSDTSGQTGSISVDLTTSLTCSIINIDESFTVYNDTIDTLCNSDNRIAPPGDSFYARYLEFTVTNAKTMNFTTTTSSPGVDPYVYLLDGVRGSSVFTEQSGSGQVATISVFLNPGTYTLEITTVDPNDQTPFTLQLVDDSIQIWMQADYQVSTTFDGSYNRVTLVNPRRTTFGYEFYPYSDYNGSYDGSTGPILTSGVQNGLPGIKFSRFSSPDTAPILSYQTTSSATLDTYAEGRRMARFIAFKQTAKTNNATQTVFSAGKYKKNDGSLLPFQTTSHLNIETASDGTQKISSYLAKVSLSGGIVTAYQTSQKRVSQTCLNTPLIVGVICDGTNAGHEIWINGVQATIFDNPLTDNLTTEDSIGGIQYGPGGQLFASDYFQGYIFEFILYWNLFRNPLTTTQIQSVFAYLNNRWNIY